MDKPYIICHMMTSVDGRIDCKMTESLKGSDEYYKILDSFETNTHICGRVTAKLEMSLAGEFESKVQKPIGKELFHKAINSDNYEVVLDTKGTLLWPRQEENTKPLLIITSENVTKEYLEYLDNQNISYIVSGKEHINLERALDILYKEFNIKRCVLVGGGHINQGFLKEKLIDEISLLIGPGIDGRESMVSVFEGIDKKQSVTQLKLNEVKSYSNGAVSLKYSVIK